SSTTLQMPGAADQGWGTLVGPVHQFDGDYVLVETDTQPRSVRLILDGLMHSPILEDNPGTGTLYRWFRITPGTYQVTCAATYRTTSPNFGAYDISASTRALAGVGPALPLAWSMSTSGRVRVALGGAIRCLVATGHLLGAYRPLAVVGN